MAAVLAFIRKRIDDPVLDTTLSFAAPYVAFLPAEEIKASGVLAVVVTGLLLGHKSPQLQSARSRIAENINWRTVQFLLENVVFLLIGLQVRGLVNSVREHLDELGRGRVGLPRGARGDDPGPDRLDVRRRRRCCALRTGPHGTSERRRSSPGPACAEW